MIFSNLPIPTAERSRELRIDQDAIKRVSSIRKRVIEAVSKAEPETFLALSQNLFPEEAHFSVGALLTKLNIEFDYAVRALIAHGEDVRSMNKAQHAVLLPMIGAAGERILKIGSEFSEIRSRIKLRLAKADEHRKALSEAGVEGSDLERELRKVAVENTADEALLKKLQEEQDALSVFIRTHDESALPKGFKTPRKIKTTPVA